MSDSGELQDEIYCCKQCGNRFMFYGDIDSHFEETGHDITAVIPMEDKLGRQKSVAPPALYLDPLTLTMPSCSFIHFKKSKSSVWLTIIFVPRK
jgi:hypothetical protein